MNSSNTFTRKRNLFQEDDIDTICQGQENTPENSQNVVRLKKQKYSPKKPQVSSKEPPTPSATSSEQQMEHVPRNADIPVELFEGKLTSLSSSEY